MRKAGVRPDNFTFPPVNKAVCSTQSNLGFGEAVHALSFQMGFGTDIIICNTMVEVYARNYNLTSARRLFDGMADRDVVTWTSLISGYVRNGKFSESFYVFREMQLEGVPPNSVTLVVLLQACPTIKEGVELSYLLQGFAIKSGVWGEESVRNSILTALVKGGRLGEAECFFSRINNESVVSWNVMISGLVSVGDVFHVIAFYGNMRRMGICPSHETLTLVLSAISTVEGLLQGQKVHGIAVKGGLLDDVTQACLVDFYSKCGELDIAVRLFDEIKEDNKITWSAMMSAFIANEHVEEAFNFFRKMHSTTRLEPGIDILRGLVTLCTRSSSIKLGKEVHGYIQKRGFCGRGGKHLETALVNMYSKCGCISSARRCFDRILEKDIVAWSAMIEGYSIHGLGSEAMKLFQQMDANGITPNSITFLSILSACSHSGLLSEACDVFRSMTGKYRIKPSLDHFTCIVDLLGRYGKLQEALHMIHNMDAEPDSRIWGSLLASCRTHSNSEIGAYAAQQLFKLETDNFGYHVLLGNLHASDERWSESQNSRKFLSEEGFRKKPGWSSIEANGMLHMFLAGEKSGPRCPEVCHILGYLNRHMDYYDVAIAPR